MKKEVYPILEKYSIYNPDFKPLNPLEEIPPSLQKNEKFLFLLSKLKDFNLSQTLKKRPDKYSLYFKTSEDWKKILYKTLQDLLKEVTYTKDMKKQNELLTKIESWYFSKLLLPSEVKQGDSSTLSYRFSQSPSESTSKPRPVHKKSFSLDPETRLKMMNDYRIAVKEETIQLGSTDTRQVLLKRFLPENSEIFLNYSNNSDTLNNGLNSVTPQPYKQIHKVRLRNKLKPVGPGECGIIGKGCESRLGGRRNDVRTPFGYDKMGEGSQFIQLSNLFPSGGELLIRAPLKPLAKL
jgi:hypothetical protein